MITFYERQSFIWKYYFSYFVIQSLYAWTETANSSTFFYAFNSACKFWTLMLVAYSQTSDLGFSLSCSIRRACKSTMKVINHSREAIGSMVSRSANSDEHRVGLRGVLSSGLEKYEGRSFWLLFMVTLGN